MDTSHNKNLKDKLNVVRIKRRREDDILETLLLEEDTNVGKQSKTNRLVYKRVKLDSYSELLVDENTPTLKKTAANTFLYEKKHTKRKRTDIEDDAKEEEAESIDKYTNDSLPSEVNSLLSDFIARDQLSKNVKNKEAQKLLLKNGKRLRRNHPSEEKIDPNVTKNSDTSRNDDFVYDIYVIQEVPEDSDLFLDKSSLGYLKIVEDGSLVYDEDTGSEHLSDDEDSNEEDYYQNDYPEDEDDDRSILFGEDYDEYDEIYYRGRRGSGEYDEDEVGSNNIQSYDDIMNNNHLKDSLLENAMQKFDNKLNGGNFLDSLNYGEEEDSDDDSIYYYTDEGEENKNDELEGEYAFPRNHFFATDQDDPLAIYRDKIMYDLEKKINRYK